MDDYRKYGGSRAANIFIEDKNVCFCCKAHVPDDAIDCPACGFPQNGDDAQQRWFLGNLRVEKRMQQQEAFGVGMAFKMLLALPFIFLFMALYYWQIDHFILGTEIFGLVGLAFLSIWIFGRKDPYRAFAMSLGLYALVSIPFFILAPKIITTSTFWVLAPYLFLALGMVKYRNWKKIGQELEGKNTG